MSLLDDIKQIQDEDSLFFRPEVLREYTMQMVGGRRLVPEDKLYQENKTMMEFTLLDMNTGREKLWTTGSSDVFKQLIEEKITEGDRLKIVKTGEVGKGKKFWIIKKHIPL